MGTYNYYKEIDKELLVISIHDEGFNESHEFVNAEIRLYSDKIQGYKDMLLNMKKVQIPYIHNKGQNLCGRKRFDTFIENYINTKNLIKDEYFSDCETINQYGEKVRELISKEDRLKEYNYMLEYEISSSNRFIKHCYNTALYNYFFYLNYEKELIESIAFI